MNKSNQIIMNNESGQEAETDIDEEDTDEEDSFFSPNPDVKVYVNPKGYEKLKLFPEHQVFAKHDDRNVKLTLDRGLVSELAEWKRGCVDRDKDNDYLCVFTGDVGAGKSSLAIQMASIWNAEKFDIEKHVHYSTDSLIKEALKAEKGTCFVLDESFSDLAAIKRGTKTTEKMYAWLNLARKRNLGMIFLTPELFDLGKFIIFERAKMWVRCLLIGKWQKGIAKFYNRDAISYHKYKNARDTRHYYVNTGFFFRFNRGYGFATREEYERISDKGFIERFSDNEEMMKMIGADVEGVEGVEREIEIEEVPIIKKPVRKVRSTLECPRCNSENVKYVKNENGVKCMKCGFLIPQDRIGKTGIVMRNGKGNCKHCGKQGLKTKKYFKCHSVKCGKIEWFNEKGVKNAD